MTAAALIERERGERDRDRERVAPEKEREGATTASKKGGGVSYRFFLVLFRIVLRA